MGCFYTRGWSLSRIVSTNRRRRRGSAAFRYGAALISSAARATTADGEA
jgi:hypothetical protein